MNKTTNTQLENMGVSKRCMSNAIINVWDDNVCDGQKKTMESAAEQVELSHTNPTR